MRQLVWPALFLILLILQGSLWLILPSWPSFDLMLPAIYFFALMHGEIAGFFAGLLTGLIQDSLTPGFFGFHMLTRGALGYWVGYNKESFFNYDFNIHVPLIGIISCVIKLAAGILVSAIGVSLHFWPWFIWDMLGFAFVNMLLTQPTLKIVKSLCSWINREKIIYEAVVQHDQDKMKMEYRKQFEGLRYKKGYEKLD